MSHSRAHNDLYLSVVAAAYNEAENLPQLVQEITESVSTLNKKYEVIIVNDGSTDETRTVLLKLMKQYSELRVMSLKQRARQSAALEAGLRNSRGEFIATLDADLQNNPADIPPMLELVTSGKCDMVNGWRARRNDPWLRLVSTRVANFVRNKLTREHIHDSACGLKVFRRECIAEIKFFNGIHRFLPTLVKMEGYRVLEVPVNHRPRVAGQAKYGISNRLFRALRDALAVRWMQSRTLKYEFEELEQ